MASVVVRILAAGVLAGGGTAWGQPYTREQNRVRAEAALARLVTMMPADLQTAAATGRRALPALTVRLAANPDQNAYMAYSTDGRLYSYLDLDATANDWTVAHEIGHYLTHILTGARFRTIGVMAPADPHGVGDVHAPRTTITEDYAYFSQYLLTGSVNGEDPSSGQWVSRMIRTSTKKLEPKDVDYPSIEGFACALMAGLSKTPEFDFHGAGVRFGPANVGLSRGDVLRLYASGATGVGDLRVAIERLLTTDVQRRAFQAMAEQIGWSYHGSATVQDKSGAKVAGAEIFPLLKNEQPKDGKAIAHRLYTYTTGLDGKVEIKQAYPGAYTLRVRTFYDQVDLPMVTAWDRPTTDPVLFLTLRMPSTIATEMKGTMTSGYSVGDGGTITAPFTVRSLEGVYVHKTGVVETPIANIASKVFSIQFDSVKCVSRGKGIFTPQKLLSRHDKARKSLKDKSEKVEQTASLTERLEFLGSDFRVMGTVHLTVQGVYTDAKGQTSPMKVELGSLSLKQSVHTEREKSK